MILNNICPFCKTQTALQKSKKTGYSVYGSGKGAIKQFFHNSCFDEYIVNQKINKSVDETFEHVRELKKEYRNSLFEKYEEKKYGSNRK